MELEKFEKAAEIRKRIDTLIFLMRDIQDLNNNDIIDEVPIRKPLHPDDAYWLFEEINERINYMEDIFSKI